MVGVDSEDGAKEGNPSEVTVERDDKLVKVSSPFCFKEFLFVFQSILVFKIFGVVGLCSAMHLCFLIILSFLLMYRSATCLKVLKEAMM